MDLYRVTGDCRALESVQQCAVAFVKGLRYVPYEAALQRQRLLFLVRRRIRGGLICIYCTAFSTFHVAQVLLPPLALNVTLILSRFTNSGVKPVAANMRSAFE